MNNKLTTFIDFGQVLNDADIQQEDDYLAIRWFGFQHPHLNVTYRVAFGSEPGENDVSRGYFSVVGNTFFSLKDLNLTAFKVRNFNSTTHQELIILIIFFLYVFNIYIYL